jgi:hypothetical protein
MPSNTTAQDESGDRIPRWAATAGRHTLGQRLTAIGARLFRSGTDPNIDEAELSRRIRQHVLRDYHAANLATARTVSEELVRAGFNTGDVPYGYRARRVRVTPTDRPARWRTRLVIEPVEASTVRMIFVWRGEDRLSTREIRRRLTASRYPAPLDPDTGQPGVWTVAIVRAILRNPKYLGRQVWGRTHHGKRLPRTDWVWSDVWVHPPLVTAEEFAAANPRSWFVPASAAANDDSVRALPPEQRRATSDREPLPGRVDDRGHHRVAAGSRRRTPPRGLSSQPAGSALAGMRSSPRTGGSPRRSLPTGDAPARDHGRSHTQRGRQAEDDVASNLRVEVTDDSAEKAKPRKPPPI